MDYDWFRHLFIELPDRFANDFVRIHSFTMNTEATVSGAEDIFKLPSRIKLADLVARFRHYICDCGYVVEQFAITCGRCDVLFWDVTKGYEVRYVFDWD